MLYPTKQGNATRCPTCGQIVRTHRFSVAMAPMMARVLDLIQDAGEAGIPSGELWQHVYSGARKPKRRTLNAYVCRLRHVLRHVGYGITCDDTTREYRYRLG